MRLGEVPSIGADPLTAQQRRGVDAAQRNLERLANTSGRGRRKFWFK